MPARPAPITPRGSPPCSVRFCLDCGHPFWPSRHDQKFCPGSACRQRWHHRRADYALRHFTVSVEARRTRARGLLTEATQILAEWLDAERKRAEAHAEIRAAYFAQQAGERSLTREQARALKESGSSAQSRASGAA